MEEAAAPPRKSTRVDSTDPVAETKENQKSRNEVMEGGNNTDDGGYNTDDEEGSSLNNASHPTSSDCPSFSDKQPSKAQSSSLPPVSLSSSDIAGANSGGLCNTVGQKSMSSSKREERNAREKDRSFRISQQIEELRNVLSCGGVIVPKGTKSSVLTEAAHYIRMLQQNQCQSELERHQLIQQVQMIGSGALGPQAARAIRHAAAQNGIWERGNFGGAPPQYAPQAPQSVSYLMLTLHFNCSPGTRKY